MYVRVTTLQWQIGKKVEAMDEAIQIVEETQTTRKVGKGKNRRTIKTMVKHTLAYTVIAYDVNGERHHQLTEKEEQELKQAKQPKRLLLTAKDEMIYQRKIIGPYARRYQKREGSYMVQQHEKYVPLMVVAFPGKKRVY